MPGDKLCFLGGEKCHGRRDVGGAPEASHRNRPGHGGDHPLGMEADPTEEKWNYPVYAFATTHAKLDPRNVEVRMNIAYAKDSNGEWDESPRIKNVKYFHYRLTLNNAGEITGGYFYRDSNVTVEAS